MKRYFLSAILLPILFVVSLRSAAQSPERPLPIFQIWEAGPLPDGYTSARCVDTVFTFDGKQYERYETVVRKDILSFKDIQRKLAPQTSDVPAVFMRLGSFRADTSYHPAQAVRKHELKGLQIFPSEEFESLRKYDPFNVLVILDSPDDSMRVYKPREDMAPRSEERFRWPSCRRKKRRKPETVLASFSTTAPSSARISTDTGCRETEPSPFGSFFPKVSKS